MSPPEPADPAYPPRPAGVPAADAAQQRRADRARQAFVAPWSRQRARRVGLVALVLVVLGPMLGTAVALLLVPAQPPDLIPMDDGETGLLEAEGSIRGIDPVSGEMALRLVLRGSTVFEGEENDLVDQTGSLTEEVTLVVSDATGQGSRVLPAGQPPGTVTVTLGLADSRATRYPLDRYSSVIVVGANRDGEEIPLRLSLRSSDPGFTVDVVGETKIDEAHYVDLEVSRRGTVIGWAGFFVLVCWLLAIASASLGWTTVVHGIAAPGWSMGFLIGVLFALPPLRNALPGSPPSGSLVDLGAFYWAVGIVAVTLVAMIGSWNIRVRRAPDEPDAPKPRV